MSFDRTTANPAVIRAIEATAIRLSAAKTANEQKAIQREHLTSVGEIIATCIFNAVASGEQLSHEDEVLAVGNAYTVVRLSAAATLQGHVSAAPLLSAEECEEAAGEAFLAQWGRLRITAAESGTA